MAAVRRGRLLLVGWLASAAATQGVPLEIVESALVFDSTATMSLNDDSDAKQCLRWAVRASLRATYSEAFLSLPEATSYVYDIGETDTKVSFSISLGGINAEYVRDDLESAVLAPRVHAEEDAVWLEMAERRDPAAVLHRLHAAFENVYEFPTRAFFFGGVHAVLARHGRFEAFGDPRRGGATRIVRHH